MALREGHLSIKQYCFPSEILYVEERQKGRRRRNMRKTHERTKFDMSVLSIDDLKE